MFRASLKSLLSHKLRLALSAVSVVLGVAFVAGSLIFTDTLGKTFTDLFRDTNADVTVTEQQQIQSSFEAGPAPPSVVPDSVLQQVREVDGVRVAEGGVYAEGVRVVGPDGDVLGAPGAPGIGVDWSDTPGISALRIEEGRAPSADGEIVIDRATAEDGGFAVGDEIRLIMPRGEPIEQELVGTASFGTSSGLAGATLTAFERSSAQRLLLEPGVWSAVGAAAADGVSDSELASRIDTALGADYTVRTAEQQADEQAQDIESALSFINIFLLVFAGVALFVGSFIILNTFSMLVAQRMRELALLRAVGASRRQVQRSVLIEAFVVGLVGSLLGLAAGFGIALLLKAVFGVVGFEIPTDSLVFAPRTVIASLVVGVGITVLAAYLPARRASRVPPVAAMRDDVTMAPGRLRIRALVGGLLVLIGAGSLGYGLSVAEGGGAAGTVGLGALLVLIGIAALAPLLSRPAVRLLGAAYPRLFGTVGRLGRDNAMRNPRRTAATASALMIGLALVGTIGVLTASTNASLDRIIDRAIGADYVVLDNNSFASFSPAVADSLEEVPGVASVTRERFGPGQVAGQQVIVTAIDPGGIGTALNVDQVAGDLGALGDNTLLINEPTANDNGYAVGDTVTLTLPNGSLDLRIAGIFERSDALEGYTISLGAWERAGGAPQDSFLYVSAEEGADQGQVRSGLEAALADYPVVTLQDQTEFKQAQRESIGQLTTVIYALLALSILIAVLGIINTLALSVIERTREIGLLRAVGLSRRQLRQMIRLESVVISVFGALLGLIIGVGFAAALQRSLANNGIEVLQIPYGQLLLFLVLAAGIGVLAAVFPARRAAKLDVLRAITTE